MDPRDFEQAADPLTANMEAETALLGILLYEPTAHRDVQDRVTAEDFSEPFFQRLYAAIVESIAAHGLADTALLSGRLSSDPAWQDFGGASGLGDMIEKAGNPKLAADYALQIADAALRRRLIRMGQEAIVRARSDELSAFDAVAATRTALEDAERGSAPEDALFVNAHDAALSRMDRLEMEVATGKPKGIQTGMSCFDKRLGGFMPGSVLILAGRPGMGKTALLGNALYGAAIRNPNKLFAGFSLEMDTDQLNDRALSRLTESESQPVSFSDIAKVLPLTSFDMQALHRAKGFIPKNLWLRDRAGVSVEDVARAVWAMKRRGDLGAIGIDYLQLMRRPALAGRNEASAIAEMTGALKNLAREAKITILLLSQLNRSVESRDDKRPMLSDLRESGSIEQDADAVLFPFREVYYLQKAEPKPDLTGMNGPHFEWEMQVANLRRHMDVIIAKNRHGSEGSEPMDYQAEIDLIMDRRAA
jgi:replicative DNA helicase